LAFTNSSVPTGWTLPLADELSFPNNYSPDDSKGYSFCKVSLLARPEPLLSYACKKGGKRESGHKIITLISNLINVMQIASAEI